MDTQRIKLLRQIMTDKKINGFLISNFNNIYYLTGFRTLTEHERESWFFITEKNCYLFTDGRHALNFKSQINNLRLVIISPEHSLLSELGEIVEKEKIKLIGFEADDLKVSEYEKIKASLSCFFVKTEKIIIKLREIKNKEEIKNIKKACEVGDRCFSELIKNIENNQSEKEIAFFIENWLKKNNYGLAFNPIVAINSNSAIPHYETENNSERVSGNSVILIDFGAKYNHYVSDMTRMIFVNPDNEIMNTYNKLLTIQNKTIHRLKNNRKLSEVDLYSRKLYQEDMLPNYAHSTGHGIGLEIHEYPKISMNSQDISKVDQVFTVEPGVYFNGKYGMRIEDTVLIKKSGVEILTKYSKKPTILNIPIFGQP